MKSIAYIPKSTTVRRRKHAKKKVTKRDRELHRLVLTFNDLSFIPKEAEEEIRATLGPIRNSFTLGNA